MDYKTFMSELHKKISHIIVQWESTQETDPY